MKKITLFLFSFIIALPIVAQIIEPIKWTFDSKQDNRKVDLIFKASIEQGWHLYDTYLPEGGPVATQIFFNDSTLFEFNGELKKSPQPVEQFDNTFQMNVRYFSNEATLLQSIKLKDDKPVKISGYVLFMGCDDQTCLTPNEVEFSFEFNKKENIKTVDEVEQAKNEDIKETDVDQQVVSKKSKNRSNIWLFILVSILAGFGAILTPCVFPMIPMTVSFFMRGSENRGRAIRNGIFFGFSIVFIFSVLGALFTFGLFGPNVGNILSTHWIPNLLFFLLFFLFAISFFGAFEMVLPGNLANKTDSKADKGGMVGAFFMALTTVIVSFSCTGPFIGALIIEAVQVGGMRPLIGMFFFGLAFAAPFTLLAIFPSAMNKLPKSGSWLNSVKVVFAFILLAFGLKFLSNIDQVYGLNIISRDIFLAIWIVLFSMLGFYFLGKLKFSNDGDIQHVGVGRLFLSIITFTFVIYLFTGLVGAPLSSISALLPPKTEKQYLVESNLDYEKLEKQKLCGSAKYADKLHLPYGLKGYFDYKQGMDCAKEQGKPVFLVFKGHACANCKKMENTVWNNSEVIKILSEKYVIVALYTDDRTSLPREEWITSELDGKVKKNLGKKNLDIQIKNYATNSIPFHVIIEPDGTEHRLGVTFQQDQFLNFLKKGL